MQKLDQDYNLADSFEINHFKKRGVLLKKIKTVLKPAVGSTPNSIVDKSTGKIMVKKKKKKKKKGFFRKIGRGLKKAVKAVGKGVKSVGVRLALAPLYPLIPVMRNALKKKGVNPPKKLPDLAEAFFNNIVKKSNFDSYYSGKTLEYDGYNDDHIAGDIVQGILKFVKDLIQKKKDKKKGIPVALSPVEEEIVGGAERVLNKIEKKATESGISVESDLPSGIVDDEGNEPDEPTDKKEGVFLGLSTSTLMMVAGVLVLLFIAAKNRS